MKMRQRVLIKAVILIGCGSLSLQAANLITNGSFESPVVPVAGFENFGTGSTGITGWTVVGPEASIVSGSYVQECCTFPAEDGNQWLDLTGDGTNAVQGVEQTTATSPGAKYTLSFWVGNVFDPHGIFGTTSTVKVYLDGTLIDTATNSSTTTGTQVWEQFTTSFTASGPSSTLAFMNADPPNDNSNGLDNVVLTGASGPSVPEPGAFSLLCVGAFALGAFCRRKSV